ncbi:serine hydrolase domain-containing protein [Permianibacter aggregans]|uniref:CubicO group peptidase (Beta-lactamase class C family) n=1 Tax=Permianibacter aggregans TaxID=1510150 RepID=A0A4V3D7V7_9GAMM|nr:serine hydrolase domain-containing protein [Permianibacter aggregans]QGX40543.1 class A beta-lactamase-related serine hydrolase [Permianibacter aggregans]TDQ49307.1 CubicO group peptidase (beta-lactamase class C family) [Permianibacter aggregans]
MRKILYCLSILAALPALAYSSNSNIEAPNNTAHQAASRIENNLLPVQYLRGHVISKSIPQVMLEENIPGVSIAFVDNGKIAWTKTYGYAQLVTAENVTPDTVFAGASLSKPIAAMAALKLVDQNVLSLDQDVNRYLKDWQLPANEFTQQQKVTLRHLIGHTSGVGNHLWSSYDVGAEVPTLEQMLAGKPPSVDPAVSMIAAPGERQKYSNPGYTIIQKLITDTTDQRFDAAINKLVFTPAGMNNSSFTQPIPESLKKRMATGYSKELQAYPYKLFPFGAAGGIWTTPSDLARFAAAVINDYQYGSKTLISKPLADQVFARNQSRLSFTKKLGEKNDELIFDHWGSNAGFTSYLVGSLGDQQALVIMTNSDNGFGLMASIARAVADEYDWPVLKPQVFSAIEVPAEKLRRYVGEFDNGNGGDLTTFAVEGDRLLLTSSTQTTTPELVAIGEHKFIHPAEYTTYEFLAAKDGSIKWLRVTRDSGYNFDLSKRQ